MQNFVQEYEKHQADNARNRERVNRTKKNFSILFWTHIIMALLFAVWSFGAAMILGNNVTGFNKFFEGMNAGAFQLMYSFMTLVIAFLIGSKIRTASYVALGAYGFLTLYTLMHLSAAAIPNFLISIIGIGMNIWALMNHNELDKLKQIPGYPAFQDRLNPSEYVAPAYVTEKKAFDSMDTIGSDGVLTPAAPKVAAMDTVSVPQPAPAPAPMPQERPAEFAMPQGGAMVQQPPRPNASIMDFREEFSELAATAAAAQQAADFTEQAVQSEAMLEDMTPATHHPQYAPHPEMLDSPEEVRERLKRMRDFREE